MTVPLLLSLAGLVVWTLVFGGVIVHWRAGRTMPTGAIAALLIAVVAAVWARLVGATMYGSPTLVLTDDAAFASHVERALLVMTGLWALVLLVRSRRRW